MRRVEKRQKRVIQYSWNADYDQFIVVPEVKWALVKKIEIDA